MPLSRRHRNLDLRDDRSVRSGFFYSLSFLFPFYGTTNWLRKPSDSELTQPWVCNGELWRKSWGIIPSRFSRNIMHHIVDIIYHVPVTWPATCLFWRLSRLGSDFKHYILRHLLKYFEYYLWLSYYEAISKFKQARFLTSAFDFLWDFKLALFYETSSWPRMHFFHHVQTAVNQ